MCLCDGRTSRREIEELRRVEWSELRTRWQAHYTRDSARKAHQLCVHYVRSREQLTLRQIRTKHSVSKQSSLLDSQSYIVSLPAQVLPKLEVYASRRQGMTHL